MNKLRMRKNYLWVFLFLIIVIYFVFDYGQSSQENIPGSPTTAPIFTATSRPTVQGASTESTESWYKLYFTDPTNKISSPGIETNLISLIDGSKTSIKAAVFEFDLENVAQALIRAHSRGVSVRVVYDDEYTKNDPQIGMLKDSGIEAVPDQRSAYMHNKFFVIDGEWIWTGSFNISHNASVKNNENAIAIRSSDLAKNYAKEFDEMFSGNFGSKSPSDTPNPTLIIGGSQVRNCFAPEDQCMDLIIDTVSKAESYIHFMAFSFTDDDLGQTMLQKMEQGVAISGIFETLNANSKYSECPTLLKQGADITLDGNPNTFHHKVIVIDGKVVVFGSFNFTSNANKSNDENVLIITDPGLVSGFEKEFQKMKSLSIEPVGEECLKK